MNQGEDFGSFGSSMHGRDYPSIRQFTVFLENRVGVLSSLIRKLAGTQVRILALSIIDSTECSIVRFVFSLPEQGREILESAGLAIIESDLIALELNQSEQPLLEVCTALLQAEVNLVQSCALMVPCADQNVVAIMVDNIEMASETLAAQGFRLMTEMELKELS
jgi:hypothetical protein